MLFYRQNHNDNIFTLLIYLFIVPILSLGFRVGVLKIAESLVISWTRAISGSNVFNVKCTEKTYFSYSFLQNA